MLTRRLVLLLACLLLIGCGSRAPSKPRNTLIYGRGEDSKTLDPINAETGETVKVLLNLYDTLVAFADETMDIEPSLATSWETSEDGLTWTFHLREGVRFHDDTPVDAEAVIFSLNRLRQDEHPHVSDPARPYKPNFKVIDKLTATDSRTVVFTLREPNAVFLNNLAMFPAGIVSPTAVKKHGKGFSTNPVGTGPFRFERWIRGQQIVLAANEDHWRGRPHLDRVVFVPVAESATRIQQLVRGEIHMADNLPPAALDELAKTPGLTVPEEISMNVAYLALQTDIPPLDDVRVRNAIAMALDKQALIRVGYAGHAEAAINLLPKAMWGHNDEIKDRPFDVEVSRKLLQEAAADKKFQLPLALGLAVMSEPRPYMEQPLQVAAFVKDSLAAIGINLTIEPKPSDMHFARMMRGDYQIGLTGWTTDNGDPDNFLYSLLDPDNISESGNNMSHYRNEKVHDLLLAGQRELDPDKRLPLYLRAQELIFADAPVIPLVSTKQRAAHTSRIKDYRLHPAMLIRLRKARFEDVP
ncbi:MAG: ABC transporter substrate-binding protein [Planctomycetales bacterium]|nr:ABC transporter substrate-binding protein [Planctomycetales bacterium]